MPSPLITKSFITNDNKRKNSDRNKNNSDMCVRETFLGETQHTNTCPLTLEKGTRTDQSNNCAKV